MVIVCVGAVCAYPRMERVTKMGWGIEGCEVQPQLVDDSIVDFSAVANGGKKTKWSSLRDSATIVQNRGLEWVKFLTIGDTLRLTHRENSRERRDVICDKMDCTQNIAISDYKAFSRRDMAYTYFDKGVARRSESIAPIVVLEEGDTVRNCIVKKLTTIFDRYESKYSSEDNLPIDSLLVYESVLLSSSKPISRFEETDWVWHEEGEELPCAFASQSMRITSKGDSISTGNIAVYPRSLNPVKEKAKRTRNTSDSSKIGLGTNLQPEIVLINNQIRVMASLPYTVSVCDLSGKLLRREEAHEELTFIPCQWEEEVIVYVQSPTGQVSKHILK